MAKIAILVLVASVLVSCSGKRVVNDNAPNAQRILGTWQRTDKTKSGTIEFRVKFSPKEMELTNICRVGSSSISATVSSPIELTDSVIKPLVPGSRKVEISDEEARDAKVKVAVKRWCEAYITTMQIDYRISGDSLIWEDLKTRETATFHRVD
jgi:hypothetical protein